MSRKSKRNHAAPVRPPSPVVVVRRVSPLNRRVLIIISAIGLLLAVVVATLVYKSERVQSVQGLAPKTLAALASEHSPKFGSPDAKVHIVEFLDPACETCASFFPEVKKLMSANPGRVRLSVRHLAFHPGADLVVKILEASRKQDRYLPTLEALYASQRRWVIQHRVQADPVWQALDGVGLDLDRLRTDMNGPEVARLMGQDTGDAQTLGVQQTPEFFVNGRPLPRFGLEELQALVADEVRRAYP